MPSLLLLCQTVALHVLVAVEGDKAKLSRKWDVIGPWIRGNFEHDGDPLEFYGGIKKVARGNTSERFLSEIATGSYVTWQVVKANQDGVVRIPQPWVEFKFLVDTLQGSQEVLNTQVWAVGNLKVPRDGNYVVDCHGVHTVEIGNRLLRANTGGSVVKLNEGKHTLYTKVSGQQDLAFRCSVTAVGPSLLLRDPQFTPHIHDGSILGLPFIAPSIFNFGDEWVQTANLKFVADELRIHQSMTAEVGIEEHQPYLPPVLAPGLLVQLPLLLRITSSLKKGQTSPDADCVQFTLRVRSRTTEKDISSVKIKLKCRQPRQSFIFSFIDTDGSVSHAAAIKPRCESKCPPPPVPVVLTLSGVSASATSQADAYKVGGKKNGEFIFGFDKAWILSPERHGPHNWEDWGFQTMLRSVDALAEATAESKLAADPQRLLCAGHSRGGHGAWSAAVRMPDRCVGVLPASGWTYRQYGGASWNRPFIHDISNTYLDYGLKAILERCMVEGDTEQHASNLRGLPILVRQGSADQTVAPYLNRRMARVASEAGALVEVSEIRGKGHWWWDTDKTNDGGVVNDLTMRTFSEKHLKSKAPLPLPETFRVTVINPTSFFGKGGLRILQTEVPFQRAMIDVLRRSETIWKLRSSNVRRFELAPHNPISEVSIDSDSFSGDVLVHGMHFCRSESVPRKWIVCKDVIDFEHWERGPNTWGPSRQVGLQRRFAIVALTDINDPPEFAAALWDASRYISHGHFAAVHSLAPIIRPDDLTKEVWTTHNLIFVGSPKALQQPWLERIRKRWPVAIENSSMNAPDQCIVGGSDGECSESATFTIGQCTFQGARHGFLFTAPRWEEEAAAGSRAFIDLVVSGTDADGLLDVTTFHHKHLSRSPFGNMAPDYFVSGPEYKAKGFGGLVAAGFWGAKWEWRADSAYMECPFS